VRNEGGHIKGLDRSGRLRAGSAFGAARRRALHAAAATTLLSLVAGRADAASARRPNVLVLLSDDQHHDTIHALGQPGIRTPNLDRLAGRGFAFTHAFSMGSITEGGLCSPSRAMLLTGRPVMARALELPATVPLWPEALRRAGYVTFGTGKWHNGKESFARCFSRGAAILFRGMSVHRNVPLQGFDPTGVYAPGRERVVEGFSSEIFASAAIDFLRGHRGPEPFLLYVAFTEPHDPRTPPEEYARLYDPEKVALPPAFLPQHPFDNGALDNRDERLLTRPLQPDVLRRETAAYYAMITHMDANVGRILDALAQSGRADDTIVVFASDNGLALGRHGLIGKESLYDHSLRVPLVFAGPGVPRGGRSPALSSLMDVWPTLAELAGLPADAGGLSLVPVMHGRRKTVRDTLFGVYQDVQRMIRTDTWKLIDYPRIGRFQLFEIGRDPDERNDLSTDARQAARVRQMAKRLAEWHRGLDRPDRSIRPGVESRVPARLPRPRPDREETDPSSTTGR
jgi:arylsulfatase A-like enzyme